LLEQLDFPPHLFLKLNNLSWRQNNDSIHRRALPCVLVDHGKYLNACQ